MNYLLAKINFKKKLGGKTTHKSKIKAFCSFLFLFLDFNHFAVTTNEQMENDYLVYLLT